MGLQLYCTSTLLRSFGGDVDVQKSKPKILKTIIDPNNHKEF